METSGTFESDLKKAIFEKDSSFEGILEKALDGRAVVYKEAVIALKFAIVDLLVAELDITKCKASKLDLDTLAILGHCKLSEIMLLALR